MGNINPLEIDEVAHLVKLDLDERSKQIIEEQIVSTLHMCESMLEIDTENVVPMTSPVEENQFLREDIIKNTTTREQLQNCSSHIEDNKYSVPSAIE